MHTNLHEIAAHVLYLIFTLLEHHILLYRCLEFFLKSFGVHVVNFQRRLGLDRNRFIKSKKKSVARDDAEAEE